MFFLRLLYNLCYLCVLTLVFRELLFDVVDLGYNVFKQSHIWECDGVRLRGLAGLIPHRDKNRKLL